MTPYPLHRTERPTKILITLFLATMAVSILVAELNVKDKVGWTAGGVVARYGPDAPATLPERPTAGDAGQPDGDFPLESGTNAADAELDGGLGAEPLVARMNTFTLLLDVTHPHVFELPLVIFVLAHFLMRTRVPEWLKLAVYALSFAGIGAFLGAPWLVRYVSLSLAPLMLAGAALIGLSSVVMIVVPVADMWLPAKKPSRPDR